MTRRGNRSVASGVAGAAVIAALVGGAAVPARAATTTATSDAEGQFPRFESLRSDKVNMRAGPGAQYPIEWVLTRRDMPVEILIAVDHWRRIRDWQGALGWVYEKMVSNRRAVMITGAVRGLHQAPDPASPLVARAEPGVIGRLLECRGVWCRIEAGDYSGWLRRAEMFGVEPAESVP